MGLCAGCQSLANAAMIKNEQPTCILFLLGAWDSSQQTQHRSLFTGVCYCRYPRQLKCRVRDSADKQRNSYHRTYFTVARDPPHLAASADSRRPKVNVSAWRHTTKRSLHLFVLRLLNGYTQDSVAFPTPADDATEGWGTRARPETASTSRRCVDGGQRPRHQATKKAGLAQHNLLHPMNPAHPSPRHHRCYCCNRVITTI